MKQQLSRIAGSIRSVRSILRQRAREMTFDGVAKEYSRLHSCQVKQVFDRAFADQLRTRLTNYFEQNPGTAHVSLHEMQLPALAIEIFDRFINSAAMTVLFSALGPNVYFPLTHGVFRMVTGEANTQLAFHQDVTFMGDGYTSITCWTSLRDCVDGVSGLELARVRLNRILPDHQPGKTYYTSDRSDLGFDEYRALHKGAIPAGTQLWRPQSQAGDTTIFSHYIIHRTQPSSGFSGIRIS